MALEHAILVSLAERAATGYDLARRFDASIGFFWPATHQQIYRVLGRMEDAGWVTSTTEARDGRTDKKTYAPTDAGLAELDRWSRVPSPREALRSDFTVKLRAFRDREAVADDARRRRADHRERLASYLESEKRDFPDPSALTGRELGTWLALRGGIRTEEQGIAWCDEVLSALDASTGAR